MRETLCCMHKTYFEQTKHVWNLIRCKRTENNPGFAEDSLNFKHSWVNEIWDSLDRSELLLLLSVLFEPEILSFLRKIIAHLTCTIVFPNFSIDNWTRHWCTISESGEPNLYLRVFVFMHFHFLEFSANSIYLPR